MEVDNVLLKKVAIRKIAVDMALPEKTVELVLTHAFNGVKEAFHEHGSIEISGFGKFELRRRNVTYKTNHYLHQIGTWKKQIEELTDEKMIHNRMIWIRETEEALELIKKLTHEI